MPFLHAACLQGGYAFAMNPRRLTPSMSLLMAFDAAARHLSFTRAAGELSLSQSVVSRQVQSLENLLGVKLFARQGRHISLTDVGKSYHGEIGLAIQRIRNASLQAISYGAGGGSIHLATLPTFAAKWLMPRMNGFYVKHPKTLVHIHSRIGRFDAASAGIDAVIGVGDSNWPGMRAHHLMKETVLPVVTPSLKGVLRRPADLHKMLLLQVAARGDLWHRWYLEQQLDPADMRVGPQFELTSHLIQAVASGIGVGLLPDFLVQDELRAGILSLAFDAPMDTGYAYHLYVPEQKSDWAPVAAFTEWIVEVVHASTETRPEASVPRAQGRGSRGQ